MDALKCKVCDMTEESVLPLLGKPLPSMSMKRASRMASILDRMLREGRIHTERLDNGQQIFHLI